VLPAIPLPLPADAPQLQVWSLPVAQVQDRELHLDALDEDERRRAQGLERPPLRLAFLASRVLLRELLSGSLGCRPEEISYGRERCPSCGSPGGRPILARHASQLQFSLARSEELVVVAIASAAVGVDVQALASAETARDVSALLHPTERQEIASAAPADRGGLFTRIWARKEAYLKGIGTGIAHGVEEQYVGAARQPPGWVLFDLPVTAGYCAAVALERPVASQ
jgi:4'-phosphopantetheinyl transferase